MSVKILNVRIDNIDLNQARDKVREFLHSDKQHKIFTPNPEMLVDAQKDSYFREVLNSGDLNLCDGKGIEIFSRGKLKRVAGVDFMLEICKIAQEENKSIYLLGSGSKEMVKRTEIRLKELYPKLRIVGFNEGPKIERLKDYKIKIDSKINERVIEDIIMKAPDILFVAFGHGKQEKWIHEYLKDLPSVKIAMGVGGAFDYLSGRIKRAPRFMRKIGLEWLYRLFMQPSRLKRIWKATFLFLYHYAKNKIRA